VSLPVTLALVLAALAYAGGFLRLRVAEPDATSPWQLLAFLLGVASLWAAVGSPLAQWDHSRLTFHMVQHLVEMLLAAPLLLLGAPFRVFLHALPAGWRRGGLGRLSSLLPLRRLLRLLTHPVVCWLLGATVVVGWHVPKVLELTLHAPPWHLVQQASFLFAGLLFWWPVVLPWPAVSVWPRWTVPLYLFLATLPCDALSAFLAFSGRVVYPSYLLQHAGGGPPALADQAFAGALMWFSVTLAYLFAAVLVTLQLLQPRKTPGAPAVAAW
jgi:cytochrome c oxidase assembly factor CtaG